MNLALAVAAVAAGAAAAPIVPAADDEVVQRLPPLRASRAGLLSPDRVLADARALLDQARSEGDPRGAGQALALLQPLLRSAQPATEAVVLAAAIEQHLHEFEAAGTRLESLLAQGGGPPQAWLMLATIRRVQGRYDDSDRSCRALQRLREPVLAVACLAENQGLRGQVAPARAALALLRTRIDDAALRGWIDVTAGELEARDGDAAAAERALRAALGSAAAREADAASGSYAALALADLMLDHDRPADARAALDGLPSTDAVLLRRARAGDAASAQGLRERFAQADQRPGPRGAHARERAAFALYVDGDARRAVALAREGLTIQRESADLLLLARAARAAGDRTALDEARRIAAGMKLHDQRLASI